MEVIWCSLHINNFEQLIFTSHVVLLSLTEGFVCAAASSLWKTLVCQQNIVQNGLALNADTHYVLMHGRKDI